MGPHSWAHGGRSLALWIIGGVLAAAVIAAVGMTVAVFPLEDPGEDERYEYAFVYIGCSVALLVAGLAAWQTSDSTPTRLVIFMMMIVAAAVLALFLYFVVAAGVACQQYDQCLDS